MKNFAARSPSAKVRGLVYFGRMLDKIRARDKGELQEEYQPNLGKGFDRSCVDLLQIDYGELVERVKKGETDEEILDWCFARGAEASG
jgi:gluconokinase